MEIGNSHQNCEFPPLSWPDGQRPGWSKTTLQHSISIQITNCIYFIASLWLSVPLLLSEQLLIRQFLSKTKNTNMAAV
jgi:hypothetical protein